MPKVSPEYLEARKNEILDAAFACFRRRGFHQTTMQDIYRETGLSPGAVYHYFRSKEEIIAAAIDRNTAEWANLIAAVRSLKPSPNQALEALGHYFFGRFREPDFEQQARMDVESWPEMLRDERALGAMRRQMAVLRPSFVEMFRQAQTEGHLVQAQGLVPEHLVNLVFAAYVGLQLNFLIEPKDVDPEGVLQALLGLLGHSGFDADSALPVEGEV
jgi:AcrR family transcriptional regulator